MALVCPNYNSSEWKKLTQLLGEEGLSPNAQVKSMKMFMENGDSVDLALRKLDPERYTPRQKEEKLKVMSDRVVFIGSPDPVTGQPRHEYRDREGNLLTSVSRKLDETPTLAYRGDDTGSLYADSGTNIHSIFEQYAGGISLANIHKFAEGKGIPTHVVDFAASFIDNLRSTGTVLSEVNLVDLEHRVAGRGDLIHLKFDGTVDLYDIKSAYRTPHKIIGNKKIWNPLEDYEGYKAQRYTTQLEYYAQMIEKAIGHPVSNEYIIPIEIEFRENLPSNGIANAAPIGVENTTRYGYTRRAIEHVDKAFGIKRSQPLVKLPKVDDSSDFVTRLTGIVQNVSMNLDKQAEDMFVNGAVANRKGFMQYRKGNEWVTFRNQKDHAAQKQELIDKVLSVRERSFRDIAPSVRNYLETGNDAFISGKGEAFIRLREILDSYRDLGYTVNSLSEIEGFEDKNNWVLIRKGDKTDMLYIGAEELSRPFTISRQSSTLGRIFGSDRSLFGNIGFSWNDAKYELGSALKNTIADAKKLEASLIAMKLKSVDPSVAFDRILIHSINQNSVLVHHTVLAETLPVLKKLFTHKSAGQIIPSTYHELLQQSDLFSPEKYQQDFVKSYADLLDDALNFRDKQLLAADEAHEKGAIGQQELEGIILERITEIEETGDKSNTAIEQKRLLSEWLYQLRAVPTGTKAVTSLFERRLSMPQNVANQVIQDVVVEYRNAISRIRKAFWEDYKKRSKEIIQSLFKSSSSYLGKAADYTISNTTKYYEPLMQKDKFSVQQIGRDGKPEVVTKELNNFSLLPEGSEQFEALSDAEKSMITHFNDTIEKASQIMGIEWIRGRIPLVKASFYNKFYRGVKETGDYDGLLRRAFDSVEETLSNSVEEPATKTRSLQNRFYNQANTETSDRRMDMLGISDDKFVQMDKHGDYETNLEVIADLFMMEAIRVRELNKVAGLFNAANSIFNWQKSNLFDEKIGVNIDFLQVWKDAQLHMKDQDSGTLQAKGVNALNKMASMSLVTKPTVSVFAYLSQQLSVFSQAMANSFGNKTDFSLSDWSLAFTKMMYKPNWEKVDLLLDQLGMFDLSMSELTNGSRRAGNQSLFRMKHLYAGLRFGDWLTRGQILIAQMIKHKSWDAYSVVDGKLVYDENKDGRFNGEVYERAKGKALKEATLKELQNQGVLANHDGTLPQAYGTSDTNYIKNLADQTIGGFDRESRALYSFYSFTKLLGLFKTWLPSRLNALFDRPFTSQINRDLHFEQAPDGSYRAVWTGRQMEGMLQTLAYMGWYIGKYRKNPYQKLTPHQQNNIRTMTAHMAVLLTASIMMLAFDDDKEKPTSLAGRNALQRSLGDILATYNVLELRKFLYTPVAIIFLDRSLNQVWNVMSGQEDVNKKTLNSLIDKIPVANVFNEIRNQVDQEDTGNQ